MAVHFAHVIRGKARSNRLRTSLEGALRTENLHVDRSWWRADGAGLARFVEELAVVEEIELLTVDQAVALEQSRFHEKMDRDLRDF